jgi:hypothetical protein
VVIFLDIIYELCHYVFDVCLWLCDLKQKNLSKENLETYEANLQAEIDIFKRKSIASLIDSHPDFFESVLDYNDWESGMVYLEQKRDLIINAYSK